MINSKDNFLEKKYLIKIVNFQYLVNQIFTKMLTEHFILIEKQVYINKV